ncbi:unnamed protein product [Dibothriocephalus latus]|uniref:Uncharacterized protein n=1 Tax=Dibothriocephalus latus TaxID=60516 RepID=A0A3P6PCA9_DIBLA|nr:unnamed protein product [Dibothriocephalus latus]
MVEEYFLIALRVHQPFLISSFPPKQTMEEEIHTTAKAMQRGVSNTDSAIFNEPGQEFDMPLFPIERNELANSLIERLRIR